MGDLATQRTCFRDSTFLSHLIYYSDDGRRLRVKIESFSFLVFRSTRQETMSEVLRPSLIGTAASFGFGDRLGLATPGHVEALLSYGDGIMPIFAQQSVRELSRSGRKVTDVLDDARNALAKTRYFDRWGADADHIKTQEDVNLLGSVGYSYYSIDPVDHIDPEAHRLDETGLLYRVHEQRHDVSWIDDYVGRTVTLDTGTILRFDRLSVSRVALRIAKALGHAVKLAAHTERVVNRRSGCFEFELCLAESDRPTSLLEHYIFADQFQSSNLKLVSVAPRFDGRFENGVDIHGDSTALVRSFSDHAAIARALGPYKLSLHHGSDKFSIYESFVRATRGLFHIKTSGTSYLEALRVVARTDRRLFRKLVDFARQQYHRERENYLVSSDPVFVPAPAAINNDKLLETYYLDTVNGRQIMHVSYGSVFVDSNLGASLKDVVAASPDMYRELLKAHFGRHLTILAKTMESLSHPSSAVPAARAK